MEPVFKPHILLLQFLSMMNQFTWSLYLDCVYFYFQSIVLRFAKYKLFYLLFFYLLICADLLLMNSASCLRASNNSLSLSLHHINIWFLFYLSSSLLILSLSEPLSDVAPFRLPLCPRLCCPPLSWCPRLPSSNNSLSLLIILFCFIFLGPSLTKRAAAAFFSFQKVLFAVASCRGYLPAVPACRACLPVVPACLPVVITLSSIQVYDLPSP